MFFSLESLCEVNIYIISSNGTVSFDIFYAFLRSLLIVVYKPSSLEGTENGIRDSPWQKNLFLGV